MFRKFSILMCKNIGLVVVEYNLVLVMTSYVSLTFLGLRWKLPFNKFDRQISLRLYLVVFAKFLSTFKIDLIK